MKMRVAFILGILILSLGVVTASREADTPPVISDEMPAFTIEEDMEWILDLSMYISDEDTPQDQLILECDDSAVVSISGLNLTFCIDKGGRYNIEIAVFDGTSRIVAGLLVIVLSSDEPPVISDIPSIEIPADEVYAYNLSEYISDNDTHRDQLILECDDPAVDDISGLILYLFYSDTEGEFNITITVFDGTTRVEGVFSIRVFDVEHPPVIRPIPDTSIKANQEVSYDLWDFIYDKDTSRNQLILECDNPVVIEISGLSLTLYFDTEDKYTIEFAVFDGTTRVEGVFSIYVYIEGDEPPVIHPIPDVMIIKDTEFTYNLSKYISDEDTPQDQLILDCDDPAVVDISGLSITLYYSDAEGKFEITITVSDGTTRVKGIFSVHVYNAWNPLRVQGPQCCTLNEAPKGG